MDIKSLKRILNNYDEGRSILMGSPIPNSTEIGWDNVEIIERKGQLYFVDQGAVDNQLFDRR